MNEYIMVWNEHLFSCFIVRLHRVCGLRCLAGSFLLFLLMPMSEAVAQQHESAFVPSWVRDAVFYQVFPERFANGDTSNDPPNTQPWGNKPTPSNFFGGDLAGIIAHLDHLASLGVNALYLNPIFESPSNHKYNTVDYLRIDPHFGDDVIFKHLVDECHKRGMRVILDGVFNHTGIDFFAFRDIREKGSLSTYRDWYNVHSYPVQLPPAKPNYECWWNFGSLPKFMTDAPGVRTYLFEVTKKWMGLGIDGWRLDVPNEIPHEFWIEWRKLVKELNPEAYIVGEIWENGEAWLKGDQFDAVMNYRFREACVDFFARGKTTPTQFDSALTKLRGDYSGEVTDALLNLLGSHDTERFLTLCGGNREKMKLASLFQFTYPGAPMIYYGDEVGMQGGKDPGCRGTMVWDSNQQDRDLLRWYTALVQTRNRYPVFKRGDIGSVIIDDANGVYGFIRQAEKERAVVVLNNAPKQRTLRLPAGTLDPRLDWLQVLPERNAVRLGTDGSYDSTVPAYSGIVLVGGQKK